MKKTKPTPAAADIWQNQSDDSFYQDMPGERLRRARKPLPAVSSALLNVVRSAMEQRRTEHVVILPEKDAPVPKQFLANVIGEETALEIGNQFLEAIINGDETFVAKVKQAIDEAHTLFRRSNQTSLLPDFFRYVEGMRPNLPPLGEIRRGFEAYISRKPGRENFELNGTQWKELRAALDLDNHYKGKAGRPSEK